jgi:GNAT superfamily N-acetyltransferase
MPTRRARTPRPDPDRRGGKLRRASRADARVLVAHRHRMFAEIGARTPRQLVTHDRVYSRWILPRLRSGDVIVLLVETPDRGVVASGGIWFRPEQPRPEAPKSRVPYLFSMFTEPEYRGRGFARQIVREAVRIARGRGYRRVVLHAALKGRPLYRSLGFVRGWEMRLDLAG